MGDTAVRSNGFGEAPKAVLDALVGDRLIVLDERCRSDHIGMKNNYKLV
jgi:hypothetical protein